MKVLNRPMFRMGGPIKEGIMSGIQEPRQGYRLGNTVDRTVGGAQMVFPAEINAMMPNASKVFADVSKIYASPEDPNVNTTDKFLEKIVMKGKRGEAPKPTKIKVENPNFIQEFKTITTPRGDKKIPIQGLEKSIYNTEEPVTTGTTIQDSMPNRELDINKDNTDPTPDVEETKKQRVDKILDSLGYKRAQKNALYDAMIKAGQRISRTGLGAENLVSDVIAETSQSYDKPEKLREAAELMSTQQDLKLEQIEASKDNRTNIEKLTEYYMSEKGGGLSLELAQRKARQLPTTLGEYFTASKAGTDLGKVRDATNQATRDGLFGEGKQYRGKIDKKKYKTVSEFIADQENFKGDGVYNVGGEAIVIENGQVVSRVVIQAKADKEGFFNIS